MKYKKIRKIDCPGVLLSLIDQNKLIHVESWNKTVSSRFINCWPLKTKLKLLQKTNVHQVVNYGDISRKRIKNILSNY
jgi:hypothetical protein